MRTKTYIEGFCVHKTKVPKGYKGLTILSWPTIRVCESLPCELRVAGMCLDVCAVNVFPVFWDAKMYPCELKGTRMWGLAGRGGGVKWGERVTLCTGQR